MSEHVNKIKKYVCFAGTHMLHSKQRITMCPEIGKW